MLAAEMPGVESEEAHCVLMQEIKAGSDDVVQG